jgi:hypothetical protein
LVCPHHFRVSPNNGHPRTASARLKSANRRHAVGLNERGRQLRRPLSQAALLLLTVLLGVRPSCLFGVMSRVGGVPVRGVGMVGGLLVVAGIVVFASFRVVVSSVCGVFCCLLVVLGCFLGHGVFPLFGCPLAGLTPPGNNETRVSAKRSFVTSTRCR